MTAFIIIILMILMLPFEAVGKPAKAERLRKRRKRG